MDIRAYYQVKKGVDSSNAQGDSEEDEESEDSSADESGTVSAATNLNDLTHEDIPSVEELIDSKESWVKPPSDDKTKLSRSKKLAAVKKFDMRWMRLYPWLVPVKDGNRVIGALCSVCRGGSQRSIQAVHSGGGTWVTKPHDSKL